MIEQLVMSIECSMDPVMCAELANQQKELLVTYVTWTVYLVTGAIVGLVGYDAYQTKHENKGVGE